MAAILSRGRCVDKEEFQSPFSRAQNHSTHAKSTFSCVPKWHSVSWHPLRTVELKLGCQLNFCNFTHDLVTGKVIFWSSSSFRTEIFIDKKSNTFLALHWSPTIENITVKIEVMPRPALLWNNNICFPKQSEIEFAVNNPVLLEEYFYQHNIWLDHFCNIQDNNSYLSVNIMIKSLKILDGFTSLCLGQNVLKLMSLFPSFCWSSLPMAVVWPKTNCPHYPGARVYWVGGGLVHLGH